MSKPDQVSAYWLVCVPNEEDEQKTRAKLKNKVASQSAPLSSVFAFPLPPLKVGTLDALYTLSDELGKIDTYVEGVVKKIERSSFEVWKAEPQEANGNDNKNNNNNNNNNGGEQKREVGLELKVSDRQLSPEGFLEAFSWDTVRYHSRKAINQIADGILKDVTKSDEELKTMVTEFNEVKANVVAYERKETGSLLVKPLGPYVKEADMVETEHFTTLMIVVPKVKEQEFLSSYELLEDLAAEKEVERAKEREQKKKEREDKKADAADKKDEKHEEEKEEKEEKKDEKKSNVPDCRNVVPRSAKRLIDPTKMTQKGEDDDEFMLYRVIVMKKGADSYKNLCRDRRFTVRPFKYDPQEDQSQKDKKKVLDKQKTKLWTHIIRWAKTTYSDVFAAWIHIKTMRLFVESVLRYGLPVNFSASIIKPKKGSDKKLRQQLSELYQKLSGETSHPGEQQQDANEADISGFGAEFYPYVYLPVTLQEVV